MGLLDAIRRRPEDEDMYETYENDYEYEIDDGGYSDNGYEEDWDTGVQPIHSAADMDIVLIAPEEYKDSPRIADMLREMKLVVLNLSKTDSNVARRVLDFVSGMVYSEHGHIMKVAKDVYVVAPYFVDLLGGKSNTYF